MSFHYAGAIRDLKQNFSNVWALQLYLVVQEVVAGQAASLICFNLGYLPAAHDKDNTSTKQQTTVSAVAAALKTVSKRGLISLLAYTGHPGKYIMHDEIRLYHASSDICHNNLQAG